MVSIVSVGISTSGVSCIGIEYIASTPNSNTKMTPTVTFTGLWTNPQIKFIAGPPPLTTHESPLTKTLRAALRIRDFTRLGADFLPGTQSLVAFDYDLVAGFDLAHGGDPDSLRRTQGHRHGPSRRLAAGGLGHIDDRRLATQNHGVFGYQRVARRLA